MSAESPANGPRDDEIPYLLIAPAVIDLSEGAPSEPSVSHGGCTTSATMLDPAEIDFSEAVLAGPAVALRLTIQFAPDAEPAGCQREFFALLQALDDFDRALGGRGLVVDASLSGGTKDEWMVVLRPLDVRWSLDRFTQTADLLVGGSASRTIEQPPVPLNDEHIAAVTSLFERRGPIDTETARDRVRNWRGQQRWVTDLQVELVKPR